MRKINFIFVKPLAVYIILFCMIIFSIVRPQNYILAGKDALLLCFNTIIPSLFPFFVFSQILIKTGFAEHLKRYASSICSPLFNVNGSGALAFIIGILSGYPAGAATCCDLYTSGLISRLEAQRLLPFCNNSGPLFIIGAVGSAMFGNTSVGIFLYTVHITSAFLVGLVFRFYGNEKMQAKKNRSTLKNKKNINFSFGKVFSESVEKSVITILNICGFIIIFSCLMSAATPLISAIFKNSTVNLIIRSTFEITLGIKDVSLSSGSIGIKIILTSFLLGLGGICVLLQVSAILSKTDIGIKTYVIGKILQAVFSAVISWVAVRFGAIPTFSQSPNASVVNLSHSGYILTFLITFVFLYYSLKKHKLF